MMMTSHEQLLEVSSRLWDRTRRSCIELPLASDKSCRCI